MATSAMGGPPIGPQLTSIAYTWISTVGRASGLSRAAADKAGDCAKCRQVVEVSDLVRAASWQCITRKWREERAVHASR
jgi:hypothetical protein